VNAGQTVTGAVDTFLGSGLGDLGGNEVTGDAFDVDAGATLNGGADVFTNVTGILIGDAGSFSGDGLDGTINGGADRFALTESPTAAHASAFQTYMFGDIYNLNASGILHGGADTMTLTNILGTGFLAGDFNGSAGTAFGGNDVITLQRDAALTGFGTTNFAYVSGDGVGGSGGSVTGGNDTISVRNAGGTAIAGDIVDFFGGVNFTGGTDTITCANNFIVPPAPGVPAPAPQVSDITGDAVTCTVTGTFKGGADVITVTNNKGGSIYGDVNDAGTTPHFLGGNDVINFSYSYPASWQGEGLFGDARTAAAPDFKGGDDQMTGTMTANLGGGFVFFGDLRDYNNALGSNAVFIGGNDVMTANAPSSSGFGWLMVGDLDSAANPLLSFTGGNDRITGGEGADQIFGDNRTALTASSIVGGADILDGCGGNDYIDGGGGADTALFSSLARSVYVNLNGIAGTGGPNPFEAMGQGFDQLINIENIVGSSLNDTIVGNSVGNRLEGGAGNDRLDGGTGNDTLIGGLGNDSFFVDSALDSVTEAVGGGSDRVYASVNYALAAGQEIEILTTTNTAGVGAINLTGNAVAQTMHGNAGANVLNGGGGIDVMTGFGGNDQYFVDVAGDIVIEAAGGGSDRVLASVNYALGAGQEIEVFTTTNTAGLGAINLTGNAFSQTMQGNGGANVLNGGAGNDVISGFGGADIFVFNTALNSATNHDTITDFNVAADTIHLENAVFTLLAAGALAATQFKDLSLGAQDANDVIIYNRVTGDLFYDSNGLGAGGQTLFADVTNGLALTAADFVVI
jgi:RTX calcium-binding nonapeptide repeat (4 copies)